MPNQPIEVDIDEQVDRLLRARSVFPRLARHLAGATGFEAPEYYRQLGLHVQVQLEQPMTVAFIDGLNDIAHWINENFVLRLYAVLDSHGFYKDKIDTSIEGHVEVDLLRRLRNKIGHGSGRYDPLDSDKRKLYETLVAHFSIEPHAYLEDTTKYPLAVGQVLVPLARKCEAYAKAMKDAA